MCDRVFQLTQHFLGDDTPPQVSKKNLETIEDASTELMMGGDTVRLKMGEAYFDCSEEYASEFCEKRQVRP